jgi:UDP-N-acetylmuramoyl-tripeptide--D-alanyl-D-alanine ligase
VTGTGPRAAGTAAAVLGVLGATDGTAALVGMSAAVLALGPAGLRWLRVAQREHYLAGSVSRFALRWWRDRPVNLVLAAVALAGLALTPRWPLCALAPAGVMVVGPVGLGLRGRSSPLVPTRRLRSLAAVWLALQAAVVAAGALAGSPAAFAAAGVVISPALLDLACAAMSPVERRLGERFVRSASARLRRVAPIVVAITGSYGKTSTKNHVAHLVGASRPTLATPASFNNRVGLARTINEHLDDGTEVFVAEMGTYGPGEIRALCSWCPPNIAVITAIGPVHLERFGSEDAILTAKAEITEPAATVVLNVDDLRLAALADRLTARDPAKRVLRCSSRQPQADVCVARDGEGATVSVWADGERLAQGMPLGAGVQPGNVACAVAVGLALGVPAKVLVDRVRELPAVPNRLSAGMAPTGVYVLDDTFNSNPAGARAALAALATATASGRRVLVTPGMVELGRRQRAENEALAREAAAVASDLVVVGRTNRRALLAGAAACQLPTVVVGTRPEAVAWVRANLGPGDVVLYENDLPDHYP